MERTKIVVIAWSFPGLEMTTFVLYEKCKGVFLIADVRWKLKSPITFRKKKHRHSLSGFLLVASVCIGSIAVVISGVDDDGFLFLKRHDKGVGTFTEKLVSTVSSTISAVTEGSTSATTGKGLNMLLIAQMQEGYAKEYLTICAENLKGTLDTTKRDAYAAVEVVLGTNVKESGYYSGADGYTLPLSDLPAGSDNLPDWDGKNKSLKNWDLNSRIKYGGGASPNYGGALQYTPGPNAWTGIHTRSVYNKGSSTPGGIGDAFLFPDAVCGLNDYL